MSPSPDTQDSNTCSSTSVVMAAPGSPQRHQHQQHQVLSQSGLLGGTTSTRGAKEDADASNPYLAGLSKKTRGLKKKMEKIKKTEALSASGKVRNRCGIQPRVGYFWLRSAVTNDPSPVLFSCDLSRFVVRVSIRKNAVEQG